MKHLSYLVLFWLTILSFDKLFSQSTTLTTYKLHFEKELKGWTKSFNTFTLSSFKNAGSMPFEDIDYRDFKDMKKFYAIYKPALAFSTDENQFIDIYSYWLALEKQGDSITSRGGEPDQAITLCNFKTKKWARIFFRGTNERIQDALWITNSKFILVGSRENELSKKSPVIYLGNTTNKTFQRFVSKDHTSIQKDSGYDSPKLLKLKIKER